MNENKKIKTKKNKEIINNIENQFNNINQILQKAKNTRSISTNHTKFPPNELLSNESLKNTLLNNSQILQNSILLDHS